MTSAPPPSLVFSNAQMVLPDEVVHGSLHTRHGHIAGLAAGTSAVPGAIDLAGDWLLPGLVEIHTDNLERHLMPRPKVHWAEWPALLAHDAEVAAAGITTVLDALGVGEADTDSLRGRAWDGVLAALDLSASQGLLRADHHLHVRCELPAPNTLDLFAPFAHHPRVRLISLMDHTPGQRQWENLEHARVYYTGRKGWSADKFDRQLALSAELQQRYVQPHRAHFIAHCQRHGVALASHDDTTVAHVAQAHADGVRVSEFPTTQAAAQAARVHGLLTVMGAPNVLRGGSHSGNVAAAELARQGLLDILSSDYVPNSLLGAALRLVNDGLMDLPRAVATVTAHPAHAVGLHDRGALAVGLRADLIRVRLVDVPAAALPPGQPAGRQAVVLAVWRAGQRVM